jgi:hypothetical protein
VCVKAWNHTVSVNVQQLIRVIIVSNCDKFKRKIKNSFINWYSDELSKGMKLGKAASDWYETVYYQAHSCMNSSLPATSSGCSSRVHDAGTNPSVLCCIYLTTYDWIKSFLKQQETKETLIRRWEKHASKNVLTIADYDYPNYLFHIYSMISRFDAHCDFMSNCFMIMTSYYN